ncbi:hypothetical protein BOX15_Mlig025338g2 [Macrostomum lignano]|uniref:leucine--tRNA ligase n=1 Tax=Macrostomum lignano TaxID=282301 RepID=A0A267H3N9_9PLAT|nr:hypothetical protein BOX15_Mlig025338g2 [Macrostomum lignano]
MEGRKGTKKLQELLEIQRAVQAQWEAERIFELDADTGPEPQEKYMVTFPYPYMNGQLHLGHVFSLSKNEFAIGFERLRGKRALWPFGLHCTGMPIKASADKLAREVELYGYPPQFPAQDEEEEAAAEPAESVDPNAVNKAKGKRSKAAAKSGGASHQWDIMRTMGLTDAQIRLFTSPAHWLRHFPPLCVRDLKSLGVKVDWRRSFITTDANPYYDAFVRWHFFRLRDSGRVKFGKRYTVFSPRDQQPCMDHDRSSGEGVGPQEYTLIKIELAAPTATAAKALSAFDLPKGARVFLVAGTLRPETMYGQTNCWIHPDINYLVVPTASTGDAAAAVEYLVCTRRSARNMLYQGILADSETLESIESPARRRLRGADLIGCPARAPLTPYERVYVLPMMTIKETKGTGVVTSVPSDAPDDFVALQDLRQKAALRDKFGVTMDMLLDPLPIIDIPELGDLAAVTLAKEMKIQSQNDREKLDLVKERVYKLGFYDGVLKVGEFAGSRVQDVKKRVQQQLVDTRQAIVYMEPEKEVRSRSGDDCVVALCDQWYLDYGDPGWKAIARRALEQLNTFSEEVRNNFAATLEWLVEHACSRSFGLGTRLPWDPQYLIESLSDSTVYMAYYTVCHLLHKDLYGMQPGELGVTPDQMTPDVWDYIFCLSDRPPVRDRHPLPPSLEAMERMRAEFSYWYPVDLRTSGKDLVPNHLTYYLYNHCSVWADRPDLWPRAVRANGHVLLNGEKMSKSTGNFLTLEDAIEKFSADGLRLALADAGDGVEDANFVEKMADSSLLRLYQFAEWVKEMAAACAAGQLRSGDWNDFSDPAFAAEIDAIIGQAYDFYAKMLYKEVVKTGVFELMAARDRYMQLCADSGLHSGLIIRYIEVQLVIMSPLCPHISDHLWRNVLNKPSSILRERWPVPSSPELNQTLLDELRYLFDSCHEFRLRADKFLGRQKSKEPVQPTHGAIWVVKSFPAWQAAILDVLKKLQTENGGQLPDNKTIAMRVQSLSELKGKAAKKAMPFVAMVKEQPEKYLSTKKGLVDELRVLRSNADYLRRTLKLESLTIDLADNSPTPLPEEGTPGQPLIFYSAEPSLPVTLINPVPSNGLFSLQSAVFAGDSVAILESRLRRATRGIPADGSLKLSRFVGGAAAARSVPKPVADTVSEFAALPAGAVFQLDAEQRTVFVVDQNGGAKHWASQLAYWLDGKAA